MVAGQHRRMTEPWPLWGLELRTPRLTLRPDDDAGLAELAAEAVRGVHPPEEMPFLAPWTDAEPTDLVRDTMKFYWSARVACRPENWAVNFLVRYEGKVIGNQGMEAKDFAVVRSVATGSWLGRRFQGNGLGTEMRAAVLMFAFDHLGAVAARSGAFADNEASQGVSRKLGYVEDGTTVYARRGQPATNVRLVVRPDTFVRPDWKLEVTGLEQVRSLFGL